MSPAFADVAARWAEVAGVLVAVPNLPPEVRNQAARVDGTYRKLAASNSDTYLPEVARVLWGMGRMLVATHDLQQARSAFTEALDIYSKFAERDPAQYGPFLRAVKEDLAKVPQ